MDIAEAATATLTAGVPIVLTAVAYWIRRNARLSDDRFKDSEKTCRDREEAMAKRITLLEERAHKDSREDRERLLDIVAQGAESTRAAAEANRMMARAVDKFAERMPDFTPPKGSKTT